MRLYDQQDVKMQLPNDQLFSNSRHLLLCCSYEDAIQQTVCPTCQSPLTRFCSKCSTMAQVAGQNQQISSTPPHTGTGDEDVNEEDVVIKLEHASCFDLPACLHNSNGAEDTAGDFSDDHEDEVSDWERIEAEDGDEDEGSAPDSDSMETESSQTSVHSDSVTVKRKPKLKNIVACCWCDVSFKSMRRMKSHMIKHTSVAWQQQHVSSTKSAPWSHTESEEDSTLHYEEAANSAPASTSGVKAFKCIFCSVFKKNVFHFTAHLHKHTDKDAFKCLRCEATYKSVTSLETHLRTHPPRSDDDDDETRRISHPHQCRICGLRFMRLGVLANHAEKHTEPNPFSCWKCQRAFQLLSDLTGHRCVPTEGQSEEMQSFPGFSSKGVSSQTYQGEMLLAHPEEVLRKQAEGEESLCSVEMPREESSGQQTLAPTEETSNPTKKLVAESRVPAPHDEHTTENAVLELQDKYSSGCLMPDTQEEHNSRYLVPETQDKHSAGDTTSGTQKEHSSGEAAMEHCEKRKQLKSGARRGRKTKKKQLLETDRRFQCPDCPSAFRSLATLKVHSQRHTGQNAFPCPQCDQSFTSNSKLLRHQEKDHWGSTPITCYECGKVLATQRSLEEHLRSHTGERPHVCDSCGERFKNRSALNRHRGKHKASYFKCSVCGAGYHYSAAYNAHMKTHATLKPHLCSTCGASFFLLRDLNEHVLKHGQKQFVCEHCGKAFYTKSSHKMHVMTHLGVKPFACELCNKSFVARNKLFIHHRRVHLGVKPYKCDICDASYAVVSRLNEHVRATHTNERPYKCSICDKTFAKSGCRQAHLRTHIKN